MSDIASLVAEQPGSVRDLFELGETDWRGQAEWLDYAEACGLAAEHAPALAAILRDPRLGWVAPEGREPTEQEERWGWAEVHVPRALAQLGGPEAAPALLHLAGRDAEGEAFGDVVTEGIDAWLAACGREGAEHCLTRIGAPGNLWLVEASALDAVRDWTAANAGPEADAMRAAVTRRLVDALRRPDGEDPGTLGERIWYLAEWRVAEAMPLIEEVFERGLVDSTHSGGLEDVRAQMQGRKTALDAASPGLPDMETMLRKLSQAAEDEVAAKKWAKKKRKKKKRRR